MAMPAAAFRNRTAALVALATIVCLGAGFGLTQGTTALMPGPLASAHGSIETCGTCHTTSGSNKLGWLHGLIAGDPLADSKACLTCHKMPDSAFAAHGATKAVLQESTKRLEAVAARIAAPVQARAQDALFPAGAVMARDVYCATCHGEHQSGGASLTEVASTQCRSCHVVKFDGFDSGHPAFEGYPFRRRTRIVFDHSGHFDKHFPETAKKGKTKRVPQSCSACHVVGKGAAVMGVASFDETCASCHLDQIMGKERASGPKGVAFLSLPGLDLETLKAKGARIGEWPEASEATLTPFMRAMLGGDKQGRVLMASLANVNLLDLSKASDQEIAAVTDLVWAIKGLLHKLITGKASDSLERIAKDSPQPVVNALVAGLPHDVLAGAQREWLPRLAAEIAEGRDAAGTGAKVASEVEPGPEPEDQATEPAVEDVELPVEAEATASAADGEVPTQGFAADGAGTVAPAKPRADPPPCSVSFFGQCLVSEEQKNSAAATVATEWQVAEADQVAESSVGAGSRKDELLFPTEKEAAEIKAHHKAAGQALSPRAKGTGGGGEEAPAAADAGVTGAEVDAEAWADSGGWYRQDYTIYYSPAGHKDRFLVSWLTLAARQTAGDTGAETAAIFSALTAKDAQGACTKCHSIDDQGGRSRHVNFSPITAEAKRGRFTRFDHEPHLGIVGDRGCSTCHETVKGENYLRSYVGGDPHAASSGFAAVKKDVCQTCHTSGETRQDCVLCHAYHVTGVATPVAGTKLSGP
jgi:hypothetical protein